MADRGSNDPQQGDLECAAHSLDADPLVIAGVPLRSRLLLGTGKFSSPAIMAQALAASGCELVTAALRRVDLADPHDSLLGAIDDRRYRLIPNTSGARDAAQAIRLARLCRAASGLSWIKLEVTPEPAHLLPDPLETLIAAEALVKEGFSVLPYMGADPLLARRLEAAGCVTVMPLAAPIGTALGLRNRDAIAMIVLQSHVPVIVDAGLGLPSHAAEALELGADAVLVNTAIATADDPVQMAVAFRLAVLAGRLGYRAGAVRAAAQARPSSPLTGFLAATDGAPATAAHGAAEQQS